MHAHQYFPSIRAIRYETDRLQVYTRTFGSNLVYPLVSENVSRSGIKLVWKRHEKLPFRENTLIEMVIDPDQEMLQRAIPGIGRVVRLSQNENKEPEIGIFIVHLPITDQFYWEHNLEKCIRGSEDESQFPRLYQV